MDASPNRSPHLQEVELALGPFTMTTQRETVCDMSYPLSVENKAILVQRPKAKMDVAGFLKAFEEEVRHMMHVVCGLVNNIKILLIE